MEEFLFCQKVTTKSVGLIALLSVSQTVHRITRSELQRTLVMMMMAGGDISEKSHYQLQNVYFASFQTVFPHMQETWICGVTESI